MPLSYALLFSGTLASLVLLTFLVCAGRRVAWIARPPAIDLIVALFTAVPWIIGWFIGARIAANWIGGLAGLGLTVVAQLAALELFDIVHSRLATAPSLQINSTLSRLHGTFRNRLGLWVTVPAVPGFLIIRFFQGFGYFPLVALLKFKPIRQSEFISVSRHKIENLVGADLVWCLYCDWMTGQWSLGTQMLNQVENFWCPLAFVDKAKCAKCAQFFEMDQWAASDSTPGEMERVVLTIQGAPAQPSQLQDATASGR